MKNIYFVKSSAYNHTHKFVRILDSEYYRFIPEEPWMPLYITYSADRSSVAVVDTEGGPMIDVNWTNGEITVTEILIIDNALMFKLKENINN